MSAETKHIKYLLGIMLLGAFFFAACSDSSSNSGNNPAIDKNAVPEPIELVEPLPVENAENISKANFDKIKNGMSVSEVEILIAGSSKIVSTKEVNGKKIETYKWETADSKRSIEVKFEDEKVIGKKEIGLK